MFFPLGAMIAGDPAGAYQQSRQRQQQVDLGDIGARADQVLGLSLQDYFQTALPGGAPMPGLNPTTQAVGRLRAMGAPPMPQAPQQPVQQAMEGVEPMIPGSIGGQPYPSSGAMRTALAGPNAYPVGPNPAAGAWMQGQMPGAQPIFPPMGGPPGGAPPGAAGAAVPPPTPGAGAPPAGAFGQQPPGGGQFTPTSGMLDWRGLVQSIIKQGEKDPRVIALAVNKAMTLMNPVAQQEWRELLMGKQMEMLRLSEDRNRRADLMADPDYREYLAQKQAAGRTRGRLGEDYTKSPEYQGEVAAARAAGRIKTTLGYLPSPESGATPLSAQATERDFASGQGSKVTAAFNTMVQHLDQLEEAYDLLKKGQWGPDVPIFNAVRNMALEQTGSELPTNPEAIAPVVAGEIVKAVTAAGGVTDRAEMTQKIRLSESQGQFHGAMNEYRGVAAGQLRSQKQRYEIGTGRKDYDRFLLPETIKALEGKGKESGGKTQSNGEQGSSEPKVIKFDPQGNRIQGKQSSLDEGRIVSDASPDPIRPGQQYASAYKPPAVGKISTVESSGPGSGRSGQVTFPGGPDAKTGRNLSESSAQPMFKTTVEEEAARYVKHYKDDLFNAIKAIDSHPFWNKPEAIRRIADIKDAVIRKASPEALQKAMKIEKDFEAQSGQSYSQYQSKIWGGPTSHPRGITDWLRYFESEKPVPIGP